jgi:hypothetical protein
MLSQDKSRAEAETAQLRDELMRITTKVRFFFPCLNIDFCVFYFLAVSFFHGAFLAVTYILYCCFCCSCFHYSNYYCVLLCSRGS